MTRDQEIYALIGGILVDAIPSEAVKAIFTAKLAPENNHAILSYKYVTKNGIQDDFDPGGKEEVSIFKELVELRKYFETQGQPPWDEFEMSIELPQGDFAIGFKYKDQARPA